MKCSTGNPFSTQRMTKESSSIVEISVHSSANKLKYSAWWSLFRRFFLIHWPIVSTKLITASFDVYVAFFPAFSRKYFKFLPPQLTTRSTSSLKLIYWWARKCVQCSRHLTVFQPVTVVYFLYLLSNRTPQGCCDTKSLRLTSISEAFTLTMLFHFCYCFFPIMKWFSNPHSSSFVTCMPLPFLAVFTFLVTYT